MLNSITLKAFTVFEKAHFQFVNGLNVIVGENGSGKSTLLLHLNGILPDEHGANEAVRIHGLAAVTNRRREAWRGWGNRP